MTKILVVFTTAFVPTGGLTTVMMNYYRVLDKRKLRIDFACTNNPPNELLEEIQLQGSTYFKLPKRKNVFNYFRKLKNLAKGYDVIHVHGNSSTSVIELFAAKLACVKKRIVHNHNSQTGHPVVNKLLQPFFEKSYTHAVACSLLAGNWLFGKDCFLVLKNAIDVERFRFKKDFRDSIRQELNIPQHDVVLGHIGKFVEAKNHLFLIKIFSKYLEKHPDSTLLLVGDGPYREKIEREIKENGIEQKVVLAGLRTDTPQLLSAMDCFVFPSLWEGLPLSVLEAQASGLPCYLSANITKEVGVAANVQFIELEKSVDFWAETLKPVVYSNREEECEKNKIALSLAGYNIVQESQSLLNIYCQD